jgi:cell division protein FtsW (lipid II flippase)
MGVVTNTTTISAGGAPNRRNTELALLIFAVLIPCYAYANVGLAISGKMPTGMLGYGLGLGMMAGIAHLMVRKFAPYADPLMLPIATLLNGLGIVIIWRLQQSHLLQASRIAASNDASKQLLYSGIGIALFICVVVFLKDHRILQRFTYISMTVGLVLLIAPVFFPAVNGARIWIVLGSFSVQPGEFVKVLLAIFYSGYLMVKRDALALASRRFMGLYLPRGRDLGPILVIWVLSMGILLFETDLGTSLLYFGLFVVMLYVATERTSWIVFGLLLSAAGAYAVSQVQTHVQVRFLTWMHPFAAFGPNPPAWAITNQIGQSLMAFGSGGVLGTGLGQGHSDLIKFAANSDFIFSTIGEEFGLAGTMAVLLMYTLLIERGLRTALAARDPFGKLLAAGLASGLALQLFVVAGGVTNLIPMTGMTMPFLALGGSSVLANWGLVGILLRISDSARRPAPSPAAPPDAEATQVVHVQ